MHAARRTFVATALAVLLAALGITAAIAANPAPDGPPKIAFLANGHVAADALAAGPIAGQLGAPLYTTPQGNLAGSAEVALQTYDPELVIVLGGPVAISDAVIDQVEAATGLAETADVTPAGGVVRAAGGDRFDTAAVVADLLTAYDPAYLPVGSAAVDADTLDGIDSSQFARKGDLGAGGGDADTLDGKDASDFLAANGKANDADMLDGKDSSDFLAANGKAADASHADDADTLAGKAASEFAGADDLRSTWVRQPGNWGNILTTGEIDVVSTTLIAPADGFVDVESFIYMNQNGAEDVSVTMRLRVNGSLGVTASRVFAADGGTDANGSVNFPHMFEVDEGQSYTLTVSAEAFIASDIDLYYSDQRIAATFIPADQVSFDNSTS